jgi:arginine utilization regulatory protein
MLPVFEAFDEGVIITDTHGRILFYNETQAGIDDLRPANVIGKRISDIHRIDWRETTFFRCLETGTPVLGRLVFYRTNQGKLAHTIHSVLPLTVGPELVGLIGFIKNYNILEQVISGVSTLTSSAAKENANGTRFRFSDIVGADKSFLHALRMARLAAESDSPVMLCGETGSGKEMFAQSIHNQSARQDKPFVAINCAAIPDTLLEGLVFGTVKGAFTGALDRIGLFEQANGGTVYLDEVNSMPILLQAKLLRVVQEKRVRRLGASNEVGVTVKIISSVNAPAHQAISEGVLRMDLFYRLAVVYITIPPLRDQPKGIETLARHFIHINNQALGRRVDSVSEPVMNFFRSYHWPGNVRELEHLLEGAMHAVGTETTLRTMHLPPHLLLDRIPDDNPPLPVLPVETGDPSPPQPVDDQPAAGPPLTNNGSDLRSQRSQQERRMIDEALRSAAGNVSAAARMLKVSRQLVHYKMRKYGLVRERYREQGK